MTREMPAVPPWMAGLPRDRRGFLVPAESAWIDGVPRLSRVPVDTKLALAITRSCAVCGYFLKPGQVVYRAFSQADAAQIRLHERDFSHDLHGPGHRSCIMYSTFVCPYLRESGAKLMKDSVIRPGAPRGTRPAVMGFEDFYLLMFRGAHNPMSTETLATMPRFGYRELTDDLPYRDPFELVDELQQAIAEDDSVIDRSHERNYWSGTDEETERLVEILERGLRSLQASSPVAPATVQGQPFVVLELPPASW